MAIHILFAAVCKSLITLGRKAAPAVVRTVVLDSVSDAVRGESAALRSSMGDLERQIAEHFQSGLDNLDLARSSPRKREFLIETARQHFIRAKNVEKLVLKSARASIYVGSCSDMLGESLNARNLYEVAYRTFAQQEYTLLMEGKSKMLSGAVMSMGCVEYRLMKYTRRHMMWRAAKALDLVRVINDPYNELYAHMVPTCELLHARRSTVKELAQPRDLSVAALPARIVTLHENYCGVKFP